MTVRFPRASVVLPSGAANAKAVRSCWPARLRVEGVYFLFLRQREHNIARGFVFSVCDVRLENTRTWSEEQKGSFRQSIHRTHPRTFSRGCLSVEAITLFPGATTRSLRTPRIPSSVWARGACGRSAGCTGKRKKHNERTAIEKTLLRPRTTGPPAVPRSSTTKAACPASGLAAGGGTTKEYRQVSPSTSFSPVLPGAPRAKEGGGSRRFVSAA